MKSLVLAPLLLAALCCPAIAQATNDAPKAVKTIPVRPAATQTPTDTAKALAQSERTSGSEFRPGSFHR
jgi:hypothetical protein